MSKADTRDLRHAHLDGLGVLHCAGASLPALEEEDASSDLAAGQVSEARPEYALRATYGEGVHECR